MGVNMAILVAELPEICTIRYRDGRGHLQELRVSRADARAVRAIRRTAKRAQKRWESRHVTFTDAKINAKGLRAHQRPRIDGGYPWEGPRFHFDRLIGEGEVWAGPVVVEVEGQRYCTLCWDRELPPDTYCLGCDRSGRDRDIPPPSPSDLALRRAQAPKRDGFRGGKDS